MKWILVVLLLSEIQGAVITVPLPDSVTVLIYKKATFHCEANATKLFWKIRNGNRIYKLTPLIQQRRGITYTDPGIGPGNLSSVLTITGLPVNDGIEISCQAVSYPPLVEDSSGSTLHVRGISPVEDIQWSNDNHSLSWSPPSFYSKDIPQRNATTYNVIVNGTSYIKTTGTSVFLNQSHSHCLELNINVVASVQQYVSTKDETICIAKFENITLNIKNYSVIFNETSKNFCITLTIKVNQDAIQSCRYSIDGRIGEVHHSKCLLGEEYDDFTVTDLPPCKKNTVVIDLNNNCGTVDNDALDFTTYHVQNLTISTERNGLVSVQCVYAESSTADGCHVIFTHTVTRKKASFNITGSGNTIISLPASGSYTVMAFDIYNGSLYGPSLEHFKQVNVILDSPDYSTTVHPTSTNSPPNVSVSVPPSPIDVESPDNDSKMMYTILAFLPVAIIMLAISWCIYTRNRRNAASSSASCNVSSQHIIGPNTTSSALACCVNSNAGMSLQFEDLDTSDDSGLGKSNTPAINSTSPIDHETGEDETDKDSCQRGEGGQNPRHTCNPRHREFSLTNDGDSYEDEACICSSDYESKHAMMTNVVMVRKRIPSESAESNPQCI